MAFEFDLPSTFVDDVDQIPGAADLNALIRAVITLDGLSYRPHPAFESSASADTGSYNEHASGDIRLWWGGLRYRTGMTTLTCEGSASGTTALSSISVLLNGVAAASISPSSSWSGSVDISTGYNDGDVILIELRTVGNATKTSQYLVRDIYATPVVMPTAWPGVPTFSTSYPADKMNQLTSAAQWLLDRIDAVPVPLSQAFLWRQGTHKTQTYTLFSGAIGKHFAADIWRVSANVKAMNTQEQLKFYVNGVLAATYPSALTYLPYGQTTAIYLPIDLSSISVGTRADIRIDSVVTSGHNGGINSRFQLFLNRSEAGGSGYPVASAPAFFTGNSSVAQTDLTTSLNAIASLLGSIKTRIDTNTFTWNRIRAMRRRFAQDEPQNTKLGPTYVHWRERQGRSVEVRGKNVGIGWGGTVLSMEEGKEYTYSFVRNQNVTKNDQIETQIVYFDSLPALPERTPYFLSGDVHSAIERLK